MTVRPFTFLLFVFVVMNADVSLLIAALVDFEYMISVVIADLT